MKAGIGRAVAAGPFPQALIKESLFRARGDMHSGEIKQVKEVDSVKAELPLFVAEEDAPDLYKTAEDDAVEIGPFAVRLSTQQDAFMQVVPEAWLPASRTTRGPFAMRPWYLLVCPVVRAQYQQAGIHHDYGLTPRQESFRLLLVCFCRMKAMSKSTVSL